MRLHTANLCSLVKNSFQFWKYLSIITTYINWNFLTFNSKIFFGYNYYEKHRFYNNTILFKNTLNILESVILMEKLINQLTMFNFRKKQMGISDIFIHYLSLKITPQEWNHFAHFCTILHRTECIFATTEFFTRFQRTTSEYFPPPTMRLF